MLVDSFKREHTYLRVSLTDRCNLRCTYCMPQEGVTLLPHSEVLRNEEFTEIISTFVKMGINKVRFTGGEPLLRRDFINIIEEIRNYHQTIQMGITTNGVLLNRFLDQFHKLNMRNLNISLDSLDAERYKDITGFDEAEQVKINIDKALEFESFNVKINAVLFRETLDELPQLVDYFSTRDVSLRFIEQMPFTEAGAAVDFVTADELVDAFGKLGKLEKLKDTKTEVATLYLLKLKNGKTLRLGVIPAITHKFCSTCNRLRLSSDGMLKTCLHSAVEHNIKDHIRVGGDEKSLMEFIRDAVVVKQREHKLDCYEKNSGCFSLSPSRGMSKIGG